MAEKTIDSVIDGVIKKVRDQQKEKGLRTYNQTLDDCPDEDYNWLGMAIEELVDCVSYLSKEFLRIEKINFRLQGELRKEKKLRIEAETKLNQLMRGEQLETNR